MRSDASFQKWKEINIRFCVQLELIEKQMEILTGWVVFFFPPVFFLFFKLGKPEAEKWSVCDQCHQFQYISS